MSTTAGSSPTLQRSGSTGLSYYTVETTGDLGRGTSIAIGTNGDPSSATPTHATPISRLRSSASP